MEFWSPEVLDGDLPNAIRASRRQQSLRFLGHCRQTRQERYGDGLKEIHPEDMPAASNGKACTLVAERAHRKSTLILSYRALEA